MTDSKLIILFKSLSLPERRKLKKYIKTPVFTNSSLVRKLFEYIYKTFSDASKPIRLNKEAAYRKAYPGEEFDQSKWSTLCSTLTKIIEDYLVLLKYQADELQRQKVLKQIYIERKLAPLFQKTTKDLLENLEQQPYRDAGYFYNTYLLKRDLVFHPSTSRQGIEITEDIKAALNNLYDFYNIERLRLGLDLKNRERIYNESHGFELTNDLSTISDDNILYKILKEIFYLFETEVEDRFFRAKELFLAHSSLLNLEDGLNILLYLVNYCMQQVKKQHYKYRLEVFSLYNEGINSKILTANNRISGPTFLNIVINSTALKKFEYTEKFMKDHVLLLDKTVREDIEQLALSYYYFHKQEYQKATSILSAFSSSNLLYMLSARLLFLCVHYEIFETDCTYFQVIIDRCIAFKRYLEGKSEDLTPKRKEAYIEFTVVLRKITRQRKAICDGTPPTQDLKVFLNKYPTVVSRWWLATIISRINK